MYHVGKEATKDHYVTDVFRLDYDSWLRYNDAFIRIVQEEHVMKPQGTSKSYLLFYRRCDELSCFCSILRYYN